MGDLRIKKAPLDEFTVIVGAQMLFVTSWLSFVPTYRELELISSNFTQCFCNTRCGMHIILVCISLQPFKNMFKNHPAPMCVDLMQLLFKIKDLSCCLLWMYLNIIWLRLFFQYKIDDNLGPFTPTECSQSYQLNFCHHQYIVHVQMFDYVNAIIVFLDQGPTETKFF